MTLLTPPAAGRPALGGPFARRYGPWAVITGASSGIGREIAREAAQAGLHVVLVARQGPVLNGIAHALAARLGVQVRVIAADLSTQDGIDAVLADTDGLDVGLLVASAGFGTSGEFLAASWPEESAMLDVNCRAVTALSLEYGRRMQAQGRPGGIVLLSSLAGRQGTPHAAHYAATKAYVHVLAEGLHRELKPARIDVVAVAPGPVRTGFEARAGLRMSPAIPAGAVARPSLRGLGRRAIVTPAPLSKFLTWSLFLLPRSMRVRMMGMIMKGWTAG